jgi:hypothetical protein
MKRAIVNFIAIITGITGWAISLFSIFKTGLGWDSVFDLSAAKVSFENSKNLTRSEYYELVPLTSEFYGNFIYKISDWLSFKLIGNSIYSEPLAISNFYFIGLTTWFISLLAILVVCVSLYLTFDSVNYSCLYFGMISSLPIWVGMAQVNSKDIPVAAGLSIMSSGFILILKQSTQRIHFYLGILLTSIGSGISMAVRPASILIVLVFLFLNSLTIFLVKLKSFKLFYRFFYIFIINFSTLVVSLIILYLSNNIPSSYFYSWIIDSVKVSIDFPSIQPVRLLGRDFLSNDLPSWYVFAWIWAQLPLFTFLSLVFGILLLLKQIFIQRSFYLSYSLSPFLIQAFFVPFALIISQPNLYNGIRHILFIYPALMVLTVVFLNHLVVYSKNRLINSLTLISVILTLFLNLYSSYRWMPYSYAFINPLAGLGNSRNWDLDYWGLTAREGISRLSKQGISNDVVVMPDNSSSLPFGGLSANQIPEMDKPVKIYVFIHWNHKLLEKNCDIQFKILRDNQVLGMGGECDKIDD